MSTPEPHERWHVGLNPADQPLSSEPACFDEWDPAARTFFTMTIGFAFTQDRLADYRGREAGMAERVRDVLAGTPLRREQDYRADIPDNDGRLMSFWLLKTLCFRADD
jgi:hypothetical protein